VHVTVETFGLLRKHLPDEHRTMKLDVPDRTTVAGLFHLLGGEPEEPWNASLNGTLASADDTLSEACTVLFFPPIAGGSSVAS